MTSPMVTAKCPICGFARQTRTPENPCRQCKRQGNRVPAQDVEYILTAARTVWAADEAKYRKTHSFKEASSENGNPHPGRTRQGVAAQGAGPQHGPARPVHRGSGRDAGPVPRHRR